MLLEELLDDVVDVVAVRAVLVLAVGRHQELGERLDLEERGDDRDDEDLEARPGVGDLGEHKDLPLGLEREGHDPQHQQGEHVEERHGETVREERHLDPTDPEVVGVLRRRRDHLARRDERVGGVDGRAPVRELDGVGGEALELKLVRVDHRAGHHEDADQGHHQHHEHVAHLARAHRAPREPPPVVAQRLGRPAPLDRPRLLAVAVQTDDDVPQAERHHGTPEEPVEAPARLHEHHHVQHVVAEVELEVEGHQHEHQHVRVDQRPLAESVEPDQDRLAPPHREPLDRRHPADHHGHHLDVGPPSREDGDQHRQRVGARLPHVVDRVLQGEVEEGVRHVGELADG
mmetsp:Transcript_24138/g.55539  ORF Transcript_24138/g.55539 Transcript_24138/m.55539 type:complete len:345 (-) Transcript_24138:2068-3102(-)